MPSLAELQSAVAHALLGGDAAAVLPWIVPGGLAPAARLAVYRGNVIHNHRAALAGVYPVVEGLVGEAFFAHAAGIYLGRHPPGSGDIHDFGDAFPYFLADFPPASGLAYLPDVARLEWAIHRVFHAADPAPPAGRADLASGDCAALRLDLGPACRLLASDYPVHRLWAMHQPGAAWDETFRLGEGGVHLLVRRNAHYEIECVPLAPSEFALLQALADGLALGDAFDRAGAGAVELAVHLQRHLRAGTLVPRLSRS